MGFKPAKHMARPIRVRIEIEQPVGALLTPVSGALFDPMESDQRASALFGRIFRRTGVDFVGKCPSDDIGNYFYGPVG